MREAPHVYGAYELADAHKRVIYIGEGYLRQQLVTHASDGPNPMVETAYFRYETTGSHDSAIKRKNAILTNHQWNYSRLPKYNQQQREGRKKRFWR